MRFTPCAEPTLGLETEWALVDADTLDLVSGIVPLMESFHEIPEITSEYMQSAAEINSPVCRTAAELRHEVQELVRQVQQAATPLNMRLLGAGTHPFSMRLADVTPKPRYRAIEKSSGYVSYEQLSYAMHVHVGMPSGDEAMRVICALIPCLPALIALSANSPYYRGADTDFAAYRLRVLAQGNRFITPPYIHTWERFCDAFEASRRAGIFKTIKDAHWHIRPQAEFGSIEIRIMDVQPTVTQATTLAAFVRALAVAILEKGVEALDIPESLPWWLELENRYRASQHGMKAEYVINERGDTAPLRALVASLIEQVGPTAESLGDGMELETLRKCTDSMLGYNRQREQYAACGSLQELVANLCDTLDEDVRPLTRVREGNTVQEQPGQR